MARALPLPLGGEAPARSSIATSLDEVDATVKRLVQIDVLVGLAVLAGLALVGLSVVRTALRPLGEIEVTAAAIGRGDLGRRVPDHHPGTEMGRLSRALNAMLEQVERAFRAQARSEARSRQLRAAHAAVRRRRQPRAAHAADVDPGVRRAAPAGGGHRSRGRVRPAAAASRARPTRMGLLVDDLLLLARLDQQRPVETAPVDVGEVARQAVEAARAAAPDRRGAPSTPRRPPSMVDGRRRPPAPGGRQPARQRPGLLARRLAGDGAGGGRADQDGQPDRGGRGGRPRPGPDPRPGRRGCSSASTAPTRPAAGPTAAPASACRSSPPSPRPTAARRGRLDARRGLDLPGAAPRAPALVDSPA